MKNNNINFTGIQNIKITKKEYPLMGTYLGMGNVLKQGEKQMTEIKISAKLTDDKLGKDFSDFQQRLHNKEFFNPNNSDTIELHIKRADIPEEFMSQSTFKLNGKPLVVDNKKKLPIMTFLARLTKQGSKNPEMSENQRKYLKLANDSIAKEAVEFIENKI